MSDPNPGDGGVIIIKGGSVDVDYDDNVFKEKDPSKPRSHKAPDRKITRIVITGGGTDYDSGEVQEPERIQCIITTTPTTY